MPPELQLSTDYGPSPSFLPLIVPAQEVGLTFFNCFQCAVCINPIASTCLFFQEAMASHYNGRDVDYIHSTFSAWEQLSWQAVPALPLGAEEVHLGMLWRCASVSRAKESCPSQYRFQSLAWDFLLCIRFRVRVLTHSVW